MRAIASRHRPCSLLALLAAAVACGADSQLAPPQFDNVVDTVVLYALTGTPIATPSAFDGVRGTAVRTDQSLAFDFAVDLDASEVLELKPAGTLGYFPEAGLLITTETFDGLTSAPLEGYVGDTVRTAEAGTVFVLRSRASSELCPLAGSLPRYSKFRVLGVDPVERSVSLEFLVNRNCGYRGLEPGLPED
jgi:hypothetical protein